MNNQPSRQKRTIDLSHRKNNEHHTLMDKRYPSTPPQNTSALLSKEIRMRHQQFNGKIERVEQPIQKLRKYFPQLKTSDILLQFRTSAQQPGERMFTNIIQDVP
jgi:hypothetical protein